MPQTLAFDIYGTLIDTSGVLATLEKFVADKADLVMNSWRQKQLEYSFRRGLMKQHVDFAICTRDALRYVNLKYGCNLDVKQQSYLLRSYKSLPVFPDVRDCLEKCRDASHDIYAFSNGSNDAVTQLLTHSQIDTFFDGVVSTEEVKSFKPDPAVYNHFTQSADSQAANTWLISGNPFDVMGARACGWQSAWVNRQTDRPFDPWDEFEPTIVIQSLNDLCKAISKF